MDYSPPGSSAYRILQARILQWVAIAFSSMYTHTHTHTHTHTSFLNTLFHYDLSQDIEHCSLCYTVGPCCSSILNIKAFNCSPQLLTAPRNSSPLGNQTSLLVLLVIWWLVTSDNKQVLPSLHRWFSVMATTPGELSSTSLAKLHPPPGTPPQHSMVISNHNY